MRTLTTMILCAFLALFILSACSADTVKDTENVPASAAPAESAPESAETENNEAGSEELTESTEPEDAQLSENGTLGYITDGEKLIRLRMQTIMQESIGMYYGCEAVSLSIALQYYGFDIDPVTLFTEHMKSGPVGKVNPFYAYVGDPRDSSGYGCYAPCAVRCVNGYLESVGSDLRAKDISGSSMEEIKEYLWQGKPVVIWGTLGMKESDVLSRWYFGGNPVYWYRLSHCVVLSGIYRDRFFVCDPMEGSVNYLQGDVERSYNQIYTQALVIE